MGIFSGYFKFIINPHSDLEQPERWSQRISGTVKVFFITWLLLIFTGVLRFVFEIATDFATPQRADVELILKYGFGNYAVLLWIVFLGPIAEELMFRLSLTSYKEQYLRFSFSLALSYLLVFRTRFMFWPDMHYGSYIVLSFLLIIFIAFSLFFLLGLIKGFNLSRLWKRYFGVVFYVATFVFALMHLTGYRIEVYSLETLASMLLILMPYFILGVSLGYLRVQFGFLYAVSFHVFWNLLSSAMIILQMSMT